MFYEFEIDNCLITIILQIYCNLLLRDSIFTTICRILQFSNKINTVRVFTNNSHYKNLRFHFPDEENTIESLVWRAHGGYSKFFNLTTVSQSVIIVVRLLLCIKITAPQMDIWEIRELNFTMRVHLTISQKHTCCKIILKVSSSGNLCSAGASFHKREVVKGTWFF